MAERRAGDEKNREAHALDLIEYNGYTFKSRAEVRWAFIYKQLGIRFVYEPERFQLGNGDVYLPDFLLPDFNCYVEIKADSLTTLAIHKALALSALERKVVYIFDGIHTSPDRVKYNKSALRIDQGKVETKYRWCECYRCGKLSIEYEGDERRIVCGCTKNLEKRRNLNQSRIQRAFLRATTSLRFEKLSNGRSSVFIPKYSDEDN